jgi:hypothetical protein
MNHEVFLCSQLSSFVASVAYGPGRLTVVFKSGADQPAAYEYFFVPRKLFKSLTKAKSVGKFYGKNIKGKFPNRKVG